MGWPPSPGFAETVDRPTVMILNLRRRKAALWKRWQRSPRNPLSTIVSVNTSDPLVALTFDDGPDPVFTPQLLDILARHGAKATFFMVGEQAEASPDLVARVVHEGHVIANHTVDHPSMPDLSGRGRRRQIRACNTLLGPSAARLFRPPYGHQTKASRLDAWLTGHDVVAWSSDVEDWLFQSAEVFADRIKATFRPGAIVLLHDGICGGTDPASSNRGPMLEGLDRALTASSEFSFLTLPDIFRRGTPHRTAWSWTGA